MATMTLKIIKRPTFYELFLLTEDGSPFARSSNPSREIALKEMKEFCKEENIKIKEEFGGKD